MTAHATKTEFFTDGLELHVLTEPQDCDICYEALELPIETTVLSQAEVDISSEPISPDERLQWAAEMRFAECLEDPLASDDQADDLTSADTAAIDTHLQHGTHAAIKIKACGHVFGTSCFQTWIFTQRTCPMCRRELFPIRSLVEVLDDWEFRQGAPTTAMGMMLRFTARGMRNRVNEMTKPQFFDSARLFLNYTISLWRDVVASVIAEYEEQKREAGPREAGENNEDADQEGSEGGGTSNREGDERPRKRARWD